MPGRPARLTHSVTLRVPADVVEALRAARIWTGRAAGHGTGVAPLSRRGKPRRIFEGCQASPSGSRRDFPAEDVVAEMVRYQDWRGTERRGDDTCRSVPSRARDGSGVKQNIWRSAGHGQPKIFSMLSSGAATAFRAPRPSAWDHSENRRLVVGLYHPLRIGSGASPSKSRDPPQPANTTHDSQGIRARSHRLGRCSSRLCSLPHGDAMKTTISSGRGASATEPSQYRISNDQVIVL